MLDAGDRVGAVKGTANKGYASAGIAYYEVEVGMSEPPSPDVYSVNGPAQCCEDRGQNVAHVGASDIEHSSRRNPIEFRRTKGYSIRRLLRAPCSTLSRFTKRRSDAVRYVIHSAKSLERDGKLWQAAHQDDLTGTNFPTLGDPPG